MRIFIPSVIVFFTAASVHAGPRTSANYNIITDVADGGGRRATSTNYTNDGSAGGVAGVSTIAVPIETAKHGYLVQLFEVTGLALTSASPNVNEGATDQLAAWQALDDATYLAVPAASVAWSVVAAGPLTGISATGLATAGLVYQNTQATAQGVYQGSTGTLNLTVLDTIPDNFGTYGGDGLSDDWQVQYFGQGNPLAGPNADPDGDGQKNIDEFTEGLVPTDPASVFTTRIQAVPGQPNQRAIIFKPVLAGRTYTVEFRTSLTSGAWTLLTNFSTSDNGTERTVIDLNATGSTRDYHVKVVKP